MSTPKRPPKRGLIPPNKVIPDAKKIADRDACADPIDLHCESNPDCDEICETCDYRSQW